MTTLDASTTTVIVNPAARGGEVGRRWYELRPMLVRQLGDCRFVHTERAGHAEELAQNAVEQGARTVLSMGGDGTHGAVVNGLMLSGAKPEDVSFGPLPVGTGGDFCRMIEGGRDLEATAGALSRAKPVVVDVGEVEYTSDDGKEQGHRYFLNIASCGLNGLVDRMVNKSSKRLGGKLSFMLATTRAGLIYRPARIQAFVDDKPIGEHVIDSVFACNGRFAGGGMHFAPEARMSDGLLDMVIVPTESKLEQILRLRRVYDGTYIEASESITHHLGRELRIEPTNKNLAYVDIDGEAPGVAPVTYRVCAGALSLLGLERKFL